MGRSERRATDGLGFESQPLDLREPSVDPSSGLPDAHALGARLAEEVARSVRHSRSLSLVLLETPPLDEGGTQVTGQIAGLLAGSLRASDGIYLYPPSRFALVLPEAPYAAALGVATRVAALAAAVGFEDGITLDLSPTGAGRVHTGVSSYEPGLDADSLLSAAAEALDRSLAGMPGGRPQAVTMDLSASLTPRELGVLRALAGGATEKDIAQDLGISAGTVRSHKARIRRKLDVSPRSRLIEFARKHLGTTTPREQPPTV